MSALEREIIEKFYQLNPEAKQRIRDAINQEILPDEKAFDYDAWFRDIEELRQEIRANPQVNENAVDFIAVLRDIRNGEDE